MNLESQVTSLELSRKLHDVGVKQESIFCYQPIINNIPTVWPRKFDLNELRKPSKDERIAAFSVAELGEMLPERFDVYINNYIKFQKIRCEITSKYHYLCSYIENCGYNSDVVHYDCSDEIEANARAKMLIYLIEQGLIKND